MTVALIAALIVTVAGFLVLLDRRDGRAQDESTQAQNDWSAYAVSLQQTLERERIAHRAEVAEMRDKAANTESALRAELVRVFDEHRAEIAVLCQRIQAPESATYEHAAQAFPQDSSSFPQSDEQLAEEEERRRVIQFIERHES